MNLNDPVNCEGFDADRHFNAMKAQNCWNSETVHRKQTAAFQKINVVQ
jgi:hypothetical protein